MSNENFKHHDNQGKVNGGLTRTFQGTLFLMLLCKVNATVEFKNHIFVQNLHKNYAQLTLQANVFCGSGSQIRFVCLQ